MKTNKFLICTALSMACLISISQTNEQWTEWGDRVHGGFGSLIAYGVVIGNDSLVRLNAQRRDVIVEYTDGPITPCACVLDGIAIAVSASLGQRTMKLNEYRTEDGLLARIKITNKKTNQFVVYELPMSVMPLMATINKDYEPSKRLEAVQRLNQSVLYSVKSAN
jgi:hypothetical protein